MRRYSLRCIPRSFLYLNKNNILRYTLVIKKYHTSSIFEYSNPNISPDSPSIPSKKSVSNIKKCLQNNFAKEITQDSKELFFKVTQENSKELFVKVTQDSKELFVKVTQDFSELLNEMERRKYNRSITIIVMIIFMIYTTYGFFRNWASKEVTLISSETFKNPTFKNDVIIFGEKLVKRIITKSRK